jgi:hypothetical protein
MAVLTVKHFFSFFFSGLNISGLKVRFNGLIANSNSGGRIWLL